MRTINKKIFLTTLQCPTYSWLQFHNPTEHSLSPSEQLRIEEGLEIHDRARTIYPDGVLVSGNNPTASQSTQQLLSDPTVSTIFEATFTYNNFITRADILLRQNSQWKIVEVKSNVNESQELIDDLAYTTFVAQSSGLQISSCSLLLINKDYRLGMPNEELFTEIDKTSDVLERADEFRELSDVVIQILSSNKKPAPDLKWECKNCEIFDECCCGKDIENHIFDLPRLSHTKFCQLRDLEIDRIEDIPEDFELSDSQSRVRTAVISGEVVIDRNGLRRALDSIVHPAFYLDFETVMTAIPLYSDIAPYGQIPTQYSLHIWDGTGQVVEHREYLADPLKDCRRELAERLIRDCDGEGSILVYTSFEKTIINGLIELCPDLAEELNKLVDRLVDLCKILRENYYHPGFHGSYSIKKVLPVVVPELSYEGMDVDNGLDASALFAYMARGMYDREEVDRVREGLMIYCGVDTMAMVELHKKLVEKLS